MRCGKADTEAPRSRVKLDSAFHRNSGGSSTLFPVKEESTKISYLVLLSEQTYREEAFSDENFVATHPSPAFEGVYSGLHALFRLHARESPCAMLLRLQWNRRNLTLPDEPVVTPRPPVRLTGLKSRQMRKKRSSRQAERAQSPLLPWATAGTIGGRTSTFWPFSPVSDGATRPGSVGPDSSRAPGAQCSQNSTLPAPQILTDGLAPSAFDPQLEYITEQVVLFWQPPTCFSQCPPSSFVADDVSYSCAE